MFGHRAVKRIDHLSVTFPVNGEAGNVPMMYSSDCTTVGIENTDPVSR